MLLTITIKDKDGSVKATITEPNNACLVYEEAYAPGDTLWLTSDTPAFVVAQLEDTIRPSFGWLASPFHMDVPFEEKRVCHSPKSFLGNNHLLTARVATAEEIRRYRNLAANPMDCHENTGFFPHASANVETRGESVFAARNAINENYANRGHGPWPYESWGVNQQADAQIKIEFGREVVVDTIAVTLRADFPHDNWWTQATIQFSDGSTYTPHFVKDDQPQYFSIPPRTVTWATMGEMIKSPDDPSPFPALTQIEFWGNHKI